MKVILNKESLKYGCRYDQELVKNNIDGGKTYEVENIEHYSTWSYISLKDFPEIEFDMRYFVECD